MAEPLKSDQRRTGLRQDQGEAVVDEAGMEWSKRLFALSKHGASDGELLQFIRARQAGDAELAAGILRRVQDRAIEGPEPALDPRRGEVLLSLRVEAIRPCVNSLDVRLLHSFIAYVAQLSESILADSLNADHWQLPELVSRVAKVIREAALDQVAEVARQAGINFIRPDEN